MWRRHFEKLLNEEFDWDREGLVTGHAVSGPAAEITASEVRAAIGKLKAGKAVGFQYHQVLERKCCLQRVRLE